MMIRIPTPAALLLLASLAVPAAAESQPPFMKELFVPELVMRHGRDIGLSEEQRSAISSAVAETQSATLEHQWEMQEAAQSLVQKLGPARVDEDAAIEQASRMLAIESKVKRAHLRLLIRIKNALSAEQQQRLKQLRAADGVSPPAGR